MLVVDVLIVFGCFLNILSFMCMIDRFFNVLIVIENFNMLILVCLILNISVCSGCLFISMLVLYVIESVVFLSAIVIIWRGQSYMVDLGGF